MDKEAVMDCPFCKKNTIKVVIRPAYSGFKKTRGSGVSNTISVAVGEKYIVLNSCPECKKEKKDVERALFG